MTGVGRGEPAQLRVIVFVVGPLTLGGTSQMLRPSLLTVILATLAVLVDCVEAQESSDLAKASLPTEFLPPGSNLRIAARTCLLEGPAVDAEGNLFFSDIANNRIHRMTPAGTVSIFRAD